ncbi:MAG: hypothetical protein HY921_03620 [Elusimicrobia bacterium]|nr:hypothetical protein [Elusimicrobiota bacterium]
MVNTRKSLAAVTFAAFFAGPAGAVRKAMPAVPAEVLALRLAQPISAIGAVSLTNPRPLIPGRPVLRRLNGMSQFSVQLSISRDPSEESSAVGGTLVFDNLSDIPQEDVDKLRLHPRPAPPVEAPKAWEEADRGDRHAYARLAAPQHDAQQRKAVAENLTFRSLLREPAEEFLDSEFLFGDVYWSGWDLLGLLWTPEAHPLDRTISSRELKMRYGIERSALSKVLEENAIPTYFYDKWLDKTESLGIIYRHTDMNRSEVFYGIPQAVYDAFDLVQEEFSHHELRAKQAKGFLERKQRFNDIEWSGRALLNLVWTSDALVVEKGEKASASDVKNSYGVGRDVLTGLLEGHGIPAVFYDDWLNEAERLGIVFRLDITSLEHSRRYYGVPQGVREYLASLDDAQSGAHALTPLGASLVDLSKDPLVESDAELAEYVAGIARIALEHSLVPQNAPSKKLLDAVSGLEYDHSSLASNLINLIESVAAGYEGRPVLKKILRVAEEFLSSGLMSTEEQEMVRRGIESVQSVEG